MLVAVSPRPAILAPASTSKHTEWIPANATDSYSVDIMWTDPELTNLLYYRINFAVRIVNWFTER